MKAAYENEQLKLINDGWLFAKESPQGFAPVEIPHDWLIGDTKNLYQSGVGYYRRKLDASFVQAGQRLYLCFDGIYMDSIVLINGQTVGEWKYGCTAFSFDITDFITLDDQNEIMVKVNYLAPNARWYTGAGIYRDVSLIVKNACHFIPDGIYISTHLHNGQWRYDARAEVAAQGENYELRHELIENTADIRAWDINDPKLYTLCSELIVNGKIADRVYTRFGFRTLRYTTDTGFFLNGKPVKFKGVCLHGDLGGLGGAVHKDALRRQLLLMKRMGVNAVRTAHNPPAKALMELTDELGLLVMSELLDIWHYPKTPYDYARFFDDWIHKDVAAWIRRDRNSPSVVLWCVGNEIHDTHLDAQAGAKTLFNLMELVKKYDPNENALVTLCSNYMPWVNTQHCADIVKLIGYNYGENLYEEHHAAHPDWTIYGGETGATVQSRGIYHFPLLQSLLADDDLQCSALGNSTTSWGTKDLEALIINDLHTPYSLGQFIWAGQDYLGEPTPYQTKNAYFGHADTAGFPKDSYYLFQAGWIDFDTQPILHLYPYWDFSPGQLIDVRACTNAPAVELFFNDVSLGKQTMNGRLLADWQIPYQAGVLKAVAYDHYEKPVAQAERRSFEDVVSLTLSEEVFQTLHFVTVSALDSNGHAVENANLRVRIAVKNGRILAMDNGDSTDFEPYQNTDNRRMFSGKLLAIVKADGDQKPLVTASVCQEDIPIRKVELTQDGDVITAAVFPNNATYNDLTWRITDAAGIESRIASLSIHADEKHATLIKKGDGIAYIRCAPKNGREHAAFISMLRVEIMGLGKINLDPYAFVAGGLYNASNQPLDNGNERGVATLRTGESHIGFKDLDFGDFGSDTLELPVFAMIQEPIPFEIWEGMPHEGGQKLAECIYDLGSIWGLYQTAVYTLPKRMKGITTLCFVLRQKVHIKGFQFKKLCKAYELLAAADCDKLYGDSYHIHGSAIENIGNNVTIEYHHMDFGAEGTEELYVCCRSSIKKNAIQVVFSDDRETKRVLIEIEEAPTYQERIFTLTEKITGMKTVSFIFLPGCSLDLKSIRFLHV